MIRTNIDGDERRDFLRTCGCALVGLAIVGIAPTLGGCEFTHAPAETPGGGGGGRTVDIDVSGLTTDDTAMISTARGSDRKPIAVVRRNGSFTALSTQCTHSQFPVTYEGGATFRCTGGQGHDSRFDLSGEPLNGPALQTGPLKVYPSTYDAARRVLTVTIG